MTLNWRDLVLAAAFLLTFPAAIGVTGWAASDVAPANPHPPVVESAYDH